MPSACSSTSSPRARPWGRYSCTSAEWCEHCLASSLWSGTAVAQWLQILCDHVQLDFHIALTWDLRYCDTHGDTSTHNCMRYSGMQTAVFEAHIPVHMHSCNQQFRLTSNSTWTKLDSEAETIGHGIGRNSAIAYGDVLQQKHWLTLPYTNNPNPPKLFWGICTSSTLLDHSI